MATNSSTASSNHKVVRIGVFIPYPAQLLDAACIDIFASMSKEYFALVGEAMVPPAIFELARSVEIFCEFSFYFFIFFLSSMSSGGVLSSTR